MDSTILYPPLSEREIQGAAISKKAAVDGMVLLVNREGTLPLNPGPVCLFGVGAVRTIRGGTGSGDPFNGGLTGGGDANVDLSPRYHIQLLPAMQRAGFTVLNEKQLQAIGERYDEGLRNMKERVMATFSLPEEALSERQLEAWRASTDTAICVISRNSGEGNDRRVEDDYNLSCVEKDNLALLRRLFPRLVLLLNVGGPVCVRDLRSADADAILLIGQAGQECGEAAAEVLTGKHSPSGKLSATWAERYEDYPSASTYLTDRDTSLYNEGVYVGYRYFPTFAKQPGFAFGYGLSYTQFEIKCLGAEMNNNLLRVEVQVINSGSRPGREVVQLYVTAPSTELDMPAMELRGFEKTRLLAPNEGETLALEVPLRELASYSEKEGAYLLSRGCYIVRIGNSSDALTAVAAISIGETVKTVLVDHVMPLRQELRVMEGLRGEDHADEAASLPILTPDAEILCEDRRSRFADGRVTTYTADRSYRSALPYEDVVYTDGRSASYEELRAGKVSAEEFIAQLSEEELSTFVCGSGWGVEDDSNPIIGANSESVPGAAGETTHTLTEKYGIPSIVLADGPGGVRIAQHFEATNVDTGEKQTVYHYCIAWPIGTHLAQSFDRELVREVGEGMNADLRAMNIEILLGPGVNIHRNPLCGRNFEYFSEDPLLAGEMAAAVTLGIQKDDTAAACVKHYALNNQETNRHANNSVASERAIREIYLEPFRRSVVKGRAMSFMTSYNLVNGVPTADDYDLCTNLARGEWGFEGLIMTDWNGGSSTPSKSMHAGNDLITPGGFEKSIEILTHMKKVEPEFEPNGQVKKYRIGIPFAEVYLMLWHDYVPSETGVGRIRVPLGEGYTARAEDGLILVNGEKIYYEASPIFEAFRLREKYRPMKSPVDTKIAYLEDEGKTIVYRVEDHYRQTICRGDVQRCAVNILKVMLRLGK